MFRVQEQLRVFVQKIIDELIRLVKKVLEELTYKLDSVLSSSGGFEPATASAYGGTGSAGRAGDVYTSGHQGSYVDIEESSSKDDLIQERIIGTAGDLGTSPAPRRRSQKRKKNRRVNDKKIVSLKAEDENLVEEYTFESGTLPQCGTIGIEKGSLPFGYNENKLVLLARSPHELFCYWDLEDAHPAVGQDVFLRLYHRGHFLIDLPVRDANHRRYYIHIDPEIPSRYSDYRIGLVWKETGEELLSSNALSLPVYEASVSSKPTFVSIPWDQEWPKQSIQPTGEALFSVLDTQGLGQAATYQGVEALDKLNLQGKVIARLYDGKRKKETENTFPNHYTSIHIQMK